MAGRRDIGLQGIVIAGIPIKLGGDNVAARITHGDRASVVRGVSKAIFSRIRKPDSMLTITMYPEDFGNQQLRIFQQVRDALAIPTVAPGSGLNLLNGEKFVWDDSELITPADGILSQETETLAWIFAIDGFRATQTGLLS